MKSYALKVLSGALALALVSTGSLAAQDTTKAKTTPDTIRKESAGEVAAPMAPASFAALLASVNGAAASSARIETLAELKAEQIRFVDAKTLLSDGNEKDLTAALDANKQALETLRAALQKQQLVSKALADHPAKPAITDVIGADVAADGALIVYFRQKS